MFVLETIAILVYLLQFAVTHCPTLRRRYKSSEEGYYLCEDIIEIVNDNQTLWTAGKNFPRNTPFEKLEKILGTLKDVNLHQKLTKMELHDSEIIKNLPVNYDPRQAWQNCSSLEEIRDQGVCGSCWAVSAVSVMTDRYCIRSKGKWQFHFSAEDLINCCEVCGLGCTGGYHATAWNYYRTRGIVSGGNYLSREGCKPYTIPPMDFKSRHHHEFRQTMDASDCVKICNTGYTISYTGDKRFGKRPYYLPPNEWQIRAELFINGPVESVLDVYEDFFHYERGIYKHVAGLKWGYHSVKLMGWGIENGTKYWLAANTWGPDWGDNGFFKILRGVDHCHIESYNVAAVPIIMEADLTS